MYKQGLIGLWRLNKPLLVQAWLWLLILYVPQSALEAQIRQRLALQQAHRDYQKIKAERVQAEKEEEEEYRRQLMAKFAEDDRIEQMTAQKRRMKQLGKTYTYNKFVTGAIVNDSASFECILVCVIINFITHFLV